VERASKEEPVHAVIGQMWDRTMSSDALNAIRNMGIPVVNISMDDRHVFRGYRRRGSFGGTLGLIGAIDLACTAAEECCLWYEVEGCPALYFPEASDPDMYGPLPVEKEHEVAFVGMNYGIRGGIIRAMEKAGIKTTCYGDGWPNGRIGLEDIPALFAASRIILGIGTIGNCSDFYALKMRDFDGPMSGSLYITHDNPDLYDLYDIGREIVTYRDRKDLLEKVRYYLSHPSEAEEIAAAGRRRAEREHTWELRFNKLLRFCGLLA
jgi:spore maturation protein CgeB